MSEIPAISVVIPVYNVSRYLEECLNSVTTQTFKDIEIIVVNDGSTDNCLEIINRFKENDNRIIVINKPNEGIMKTRRTGIAKAKGEFIFQLDGDDYLAEDALGKLYAEAKETDADMVIGDHTILYKDMVIPIYWDLFPRYMNNVDFLKMQLKYPFYFWCRLIRRTFFDDIEYPKGILIYEELPMMVQIVPKLKKVVKVPVNVNYYRQRSSSITKEKEKIMYISIYEATLYLKEFLEKQSFFDQLKPEFALYYLDAVFFCIIYGLDIKNYNKNINASLHKYMDDPKLKLYLKKNQNKSKHWLCYVANKNLNLVSFLLGLFSPVLMCKYKWDDRNKKRGCLFD